MGERQNRSDSARASLSAFGSGRAIAPPPAGPTLASRQRSLESAPPPAGSARIEDTEETPPGSRRVFPFDAELEVAEVDGGKAGTPWSARARTLSTGSLSFSSRRMCYLERRVVIAVHRVDDNPMMLLGRVTDCRYDSDGLYTIDIDLLPTDESDVKLSFSRKVA